MDYDFLKCGVGVIIKHVTLLYGEENSNVLYFVLMVFESNSIC
jgi:hypothetical protein